MMSIINLSRTMTMCTNIPSKLSFCETTFWETVIPKISLIPNHAIIYIYIYLNTALTQFWGPIDASQCAFLKSWLRPHSQPSSLLSYYTHTIIALRPSIRQPRTTPISKSSLELFRLPRPKYNCLALLFPFLPPAMWRIQVLSLSGPEWHAVFSPENYAYSKTTKLFAGFLSESAPGLSIPHLRLHE